MNKIFDRLYFNGPLGLGDSFVVSGLVHYYADRCVEMHVPALPKFFDTIKCLYQDHSHIKVIPISNDQEEDSYCYENRLSKIIRIPLQHTIVRGFDIHPVWDMQWYANHELPFGLRYTNFRLPAYVEGAEELYQQLSDNEPYILLHRYTGDHPDGLPINVSTFRAANQMPNFKIIEIDHTITGNMLQFIKLIERAQEIHCVPSSFHCLVDSVKTQARLFFHDIREKTSMVVNSGWNNNKWIVVNYISRM